MKKTIVFDFDGTVADTLPVCFYAFQQVFYKFDGLDLSEEDILSMFGPTEEAIIEQNLRNHPKVNDAISHYLKTYQEKHVEYVKPLFPLHELLADIKKAGHQIAILTGKGRRSLEISLDQLGLHGLFDMLVSGDDVTRPKPDPQGLYIIMKELGAKANDMLMIGDSDADIEAGLRAKVQTVRVDWFLSSSPRRFQSQPDYVLTEVEKLRELINQLQISN